MTKKPNLFVEFVVACKNRESSEKIKDFLDKFALKISEERRWIKLIDALFYHAVFHGRRETVEMLISRGANVNKIYKKQQSSLSIAYKHDNRHLYNLLIANGANFNCPHGFKLLMANCRRREMGDFEFLLKNGAPTNGCDKNKACPLILASENGSVEKVRLLLKQSTSQINHQGKYNSSALNLACENKHLEVARLLIEHGADVNSIDICKNTPIINILNLRIDGDEIFRQVMLIVRMFIENGARLNMEKQTALTVLLRNYYFRREFLEEVVRLLLENGVDVNIKDYHKGETALIIALDWKKYEIANLLIENGASLDIKDNDGNTALMIASTCGLNLSQSIIARKADVNLQNNQGETALMIAIQYKNLNIAKLLIQHGANLDLVDNNGNNALMMNARFLNDVEITRMALERNVNINLQNNQGETALMLALQNRYLETSSARLLIENGANLDLKDEKGNTALMIAIRNHPFSEIVQAILEKKPNIDLQNENGQTCLIMAFKNRNYEIAKMLIISGADLDLMDMDGDTALMIGVLFCPDVEIVQMMLEKNPNIDLQNKYGYTALISALEDEKYELAKMLIEYGANLELADNNGNTALMIATETRNDNAVRPLVEMMLRKNTNLNINVQNNKQETALAIAIENANVKIAEFLLEREADPNLRLENGNTALMLAAQSSKEKDLLPIVEMMIQRNAALNAFNIESKTALILALESENLEIARLLIERGASLDHVDKRGQTALMCALLVSNSKSFYLPSQCVELIKLIVQKNANLNARNEKGETALVFALRRGNWELAELFIKNGAKLESMVEDGTLMAAIKHCPRIELIQMMFAKNKSINLNNEQGEKALMVALQNRNQDIAELLIERGVHIGSVDPYGNTSLIIATQHCPNVEIIQKIINKNTSINLQNQEGETALMIAVGRGHVKIAKIFMELEPDFDLRNKYGDTALILAARLPESKQTLPLIQMMIEKKANVNIQNKKGETALMIAAKKGNLCIVQMLLEHGADFNLKDKKTNVNIQNEMGETALMVAAKAGNESIVQMLLGQGADFNLRDKNDKNALFHAYWGYTDAGKIDTLKCLINTSTDLDSQSFGSNTLLHNACVNGEIELVYLLIEKGVNLNIQNKEGKTPLMISFERKYFIISEMLIESDADLHLVDEEGESVWFYLCGFNSYRFKTGNAYKKKDYKRDNLFLSKKYLASNHMSWYYQQVQGRTLPKRNDLDEIKNYFIDCHKRCLKKLSKRSDRFDMPNKRGQTPLLEALKCESDKWIIELLIGKGANVLHKNEDGENALYLAILKNFFQIAELLINKGANVNEKINSQSLFYLACTSNHIDSHFCELLIKNGVNLHCRYERQSAFESLCEKSPSRNGKFEIFRNALIEELSKTFKYTDYEMFKQRVIESIENEEVIVVESDHLKALSRLSRDKKEENLTILYFSDSGKKAIEHLESLEFRERLIADYLNVLKDQKELLDIRKLKLTESVTELSEQYEPIRKKFKADPVHLKLNDLIARESFQRLFDSAKMQQDSEQQRDELNILIENINRYISKLTSKIQVGYELLEVVEKL